MSKSKSTARKSSSKESGTVYWTPPLSSETSEPLSQKVTPKHIGAWLTSLPQDSPASRSVSQESRKQPQTKEICGRLRSKPFALLDPDTHCWKTSQGSLLSLMGISEPSFVDFPKQGMMRDGQCWERTTLAPHTKGTGCGLWLGTPRATEAVRSEKFKKGRAPSPEEFVKLWPTPRNRMTGKVHPNRSTDKFNNLESVISREMWPTPKANIVHPVIHDGNREKLANRNKANLEEVVAKTPKATGQLNPDWVEWLQGWPIGWSSLEQIVDLIWLDWSVDPADMEMPEKMPTHRTSDSDHGHAGTWSTTGKNLHNYALNKGKRNGWKRCGAGSGPVPRVATGIKDRVNRLKAIGNGQVPQCTALAWETLNP